LQSWKPLDSNRRLVDGNCGSLFLSPSVKPGNSPHVWNDWRTL
jgi:hypothetical protein